MTELEKIERAKMYMDKLANGINPIDDTMTPWHQTMILSTMSGYRVAFSSYLTCCGR